MSDCRIFALLKLLGSDMNEVWGAHLFLCVCMCVCVKLTSQLTKIGDRSLYSKNTNIERLPFNSEQSKEYWSTCHF